MSGRELPESLTTVLFLARDLETSARGSHRERAAIAATSVLLLAAIDAGWQQLELARALGMKLGTVHKRIQSARQSHPDGTGVVVDAPLDRPPAPLAVLRRPVDQRGWLTVTEAAAYLGKDPETVRNWLNRGVLPNTDRRVANRHLYLRADLDRVMAAPRRGKRQIYPDFDQLLEQITSTWV